MKIKRAKQIMGKAASFILAALISVNGTSAAVLCYPLKIGERSFKEVIYFGLV